MKREERKKLAQTLSTELDEIKLTLPMPGIESQIRQEVFIEQLIDSIRRVQYVYVMKRRRNISSQCADPNNDAFDPIKASIYFQRLGNINESFWLVFLSTHFGKNLKHRWKMLQAVYGGLQSGTVWTWERITEDFDLFSEWISQNYLSIPRAFGNHRKFETLKPGSIRSPSSVVKSYINWVGHQDHAHLIKKAIKISGDNPRCLFDELYNTMDCVNSFGRTAKFDYLTMLGKLGLVEIEPSKTYMEGSTGPQKGANLLFQYNPAKKFSNEQLENMLACLDQELSLGEMGMQVLEDALCNWQKNPEQYKLFRG